MAMVRVVLMTCLIWLVIGYDAFAQPPIEIIRNSEFSFSIAKKKVRVLSMNLIQNDNVTLNLKTTVGTNVRILNPEGNVITETLLKKFSYVWEKAITVTGMYTIEVENISPWWATEVLGSLMIRRPNFIYGPGDPSKDPSIKKDSAATETVLTDGRFQMTKANPKKYNYPFEKGDTLNLQLIPLLGVRPFVEINNDLKELVFASLPGKNSLSVAIPILEKGTYTITMETPSFFEANPFTGMIDSIRITRRSPVKYLKAEAPATGVAKVELDTVAEVFIDTVIYLGALRDFIHPSYRNFKLPIENAPNLLFWGLLFGAGHEFVKEENLFRPLLEGEALASGATDILSAYGLGFLKKLPGLGTADVVFTPSPDIQTGLVRNSTPNYALLYNKGKEDYLMFENKNKSVGHNVYIKVMLFKTVVKNGK